MRTIRVILQGGLGNQLFTYFAAANYASSRNIKLVLDTSELPFGISSRKLELSKLNLPVKYKVSNLKAFGNSSTNILFFRVRKLLLRTLTFLSFESKVVGYDPALNERRLFLYLRGYFQSWKYLKEFRDSGVDIDLVPLTKSDSFIKCLEKLEDEDPICLHVRRGDYLKVINEFGCLSEDYFRSALDLVLDSSKPIWLFSDDPEGVVSEFKKIRFDFVPAFEYPLEDYESLCIMAQSRTLIMSNSSFSWWGASSGKLDKTVICPSPWFKNMESPDEIIQKNWITLKPNWVS